MLCCNTDAIDAARPLHLNRHALSPVSGVLSKSRTDTSMRGSAIGSARGGTKAAVSSAPAGGAGSPRGAGALGGDGEKDQRGGGGGGLNSVASSIMQAGCNMKKEIAASMSLAAGGAAGGWGVGELSKNAMSSMRLAVGGAGGGQGGALGPGDGGQCAGGVDAPAAKGAGEQKKREGEQRKRGAGSRKDEVANGEAYMKEHYELGRVIEEGSNGTVYVGVDRRSGEEVAVKVIDMWGGSREDENQKEIWQQVQHENVVRLLDYSKTASKLYFVMELATGNGLQARHPEPDTPNPRPSILNFLLQQTRTPRVCLRVS